MKHPISGCKLRGLVGCIESSSHQASLGLKSLCAYKAQPQGGNRAGSGQKTVPKSDPTFHLGRTGSGQFCKSIAQIRACFGTFWVWVGLGRARLNEPEHFSPFEGVWHLSW
jgi:hypothetical protein